MRHRFFPVARGASIALLLLLVSLSATAQRVADRQLFAVSAGRPPDAITYPTITYATVRVPL
jgi:hypothetical protein